MKLIFAVLMFVAGVVVTGGVYLFVRKPDQKKSDFEKLQSVPNWLAQRVHQIGDYLSGLLRSKPGTIIDSPMAAPTAPAE
jgi:hypothetical protein